MQFNIPEEKSSIIKVIGVGGGGSNAVTHMFKQGIIGVNFAISNTDSQAMESCPVNTKIQLGPSLTEGRGAGSRPNIGKESCIESIEEIRQFLANDTKMLFITAGMGGGTGTGAAPVVAKAAQEMDIMTVGIVTLPFAFEGRRRNKQAAEGLEELKKHVDTIIVISNDKLREIHGNLALSEAFSKADDILTVAAKGIAEIITVPGYINVDFEDVNTVMRGSGLAIMGTSIVEGENRARRSVEEALNCPLLEDNDISGAQHILLNITSGNKEVTMDEIFEITEYVQEEAGNETDLIWGNCYDESLGDKICVTIIATGFERRDKKPVQQKPAPQKMTVPVTENIYDKYEPTISEIVAEEEPVTDEKPVVFEFEDVRPSSSQPPVANGSFDEPYIREYSNEARKNLSPNRYENKRPASANPVKLNNPNTLVDLENQPAYLRRKVNLEDVAHSSETTVSKWTITDDENMILKENNSFLHDNVD